MFNYSEKCLTKRRFGSSELGTPVAPRSLQMVQPQLALNKLIYQTVTAETKRSAEA